MNDPNYCSPNAKTWDNLVAHLVLLPGDPQEILLGAMTKLAAAMQDRGDDRDFVRAEVEDAIRRYAALYRAAAPHQGRA